jgi:biotin transport system permease protein
VGVSGAAGHAAKGALVRSLDARVVLLLGLLFGVLVWRAGLAGNALYAAFFTAVLVTLGATRAEALRLLRSAAPFALAWGGVKLVSDLAAGVTRAEALWSVALLSARLAVLVILGAALAAAVTPRALGLALTSLTRPVLRRTAWRLGLALLLMIHLVPRTFAAFRDARTALRVRRVALPRLRAIAVVVEAATRNLASLTWDQAVAVAARRLDGPEPWEGSPRLLLRDLCAGALVAALALAAAGL